MPESLPMNLLFSNKSFLVILKKTSGDLFLMLKFSNLPLIGIILRGAPEELSLLHGQT